MSRRKRSKAERKYNRRRQERNQDCLADMLQWLLPDDTIFSEMKMHGNAKSKPRELVRLALLWAWSERRHLTDAFEEAVMCCHSMFGVGGPRTYQGLMKALTRRNQELMRLLWPVLHERMQEIGAQFWQVGKWVPIAFDGSRSTAPRTEANERAFCAQDYGKGKTAKYRKKKTKGLRRRKNEKNRPEPQEPQAWITLLWHMGLRLPWMWRLGPSNSSERGHVMEMIEEGEYPENVLFVGDAGFVGFPLWSAIEQSGGRFLVRVGANVSLLREHADYQLMEDGSVLCWPKAVQSKQPPLHLRLVKVRIGNSDVYLLTNVLQADQLSIQEMITLYKMRWGIEVEFRGLKQTLDRAKLRCRNHERLLVELDWSIMAMATAELLALKEQLPKKRRRSAEPVSTPAQRSLANAMRALRDCIRRPQEIPPIGKDLPTRLRKAVTDSYQRKSSKKARYRPPNPDKKPLGKPKLRVLTPKERRKVAQIESRAAA